MRTRFALVLAVAMLMLLACRPTPSNSIEYLHREDTIIIQMLSLDDGLLEIDRALAVPEFTLYGDGTLIYQSHMADGTRLLQTSLPEDAVLDLLESIVDEGFLEFTYAQPTPNTASDETTFIYAHTRDLANAVSVQGLSAPLAEDAGGEFDQYRKVQMLIKMLRALDPVAIGGFDPTTYVAEAYLVASLTVDGVPTQEEMTSAEVVELLAGFGRTSGSALEDLAIPMRIDPGFGPAVRLAPLLPFHENFPEFDLQ